MIFIASLNHPSGTPRSLATIRWLAAATLGLYPAGCLVRLLGPDTLAVQLAGFLLILAALICGAVLAGSQLARVTSDLADKLDEYQRGLRARALAGAYTLFTVLILVAVIYLALASDFGGWVPTGYEQWSAIFWGLFITASTLPTAVLAWRLTPSEFGEGVEA